MFREIAALPTHPTGLRASPRNVNARFKLTHEPRAPYSFVGSSLRSGLPLHLHLIQSAFKCTQIRCSKKGTWQPLVLSPMVPLDFFENVLSLLVKLFKRFHLILREKFFSFQKFSRMQGSDTNHQISGLSKWRYLFDKRYNKVFRLAWCIIFMCAASIYIFYSYHIILEHRSQVLKFRQKNSDDWGEIVFPVVHFFNENQIR